MVYERFTEYFIVLLIFALSFTSTSESIIVKSKVGLIRGLRALDGNYSMYLGIPYARVNESNPFGESLAYPHFETEFEAFNDTAICPQQEEFNLTIVGNLDCLHLNIYVPDAVAKATKLPVLVNIFGGQARIGFAGRYIYGPKYLVEHDIIFITFNYRVGPYGFFCLSTPEVSGNQGYKDQVKALRWIRDNIEAFGGDSNKITVSGHSSGATSLDYIVHTLNDENLFDKIILQSGNAYSAAIEIREPDDGLPIKLANKLGYNASSLDDALHYLTITDPKLVINASVSLDPLYSTCLENTSDDIQKIPPDYPINLKLPMITNLSILIGNTNAETIYFFDPLSSDDIKKLDLFKHHLNLDLKDEVYMKEMEDIVYQFYFGETEQSLLSKNEAMKFSADFYYIYPSKITLKKYLEAGAKNVYYSIFSYDGGRNFVKYRAHISRPGASHADEQGYLYDMSIFNTTLSENDALMIKRMTTLWTNFVKYGNPTPATTELLPLQWLPYHQSTELYMNIDLEMSLRTGPYFRRMAFWDLFFDINEKFIKGVK
ncbi:juvenile hormone esterase-like [Bombyx mori]|uniref:juvenile hormone esterase-like n=1 Tax=Bombyx mori TaxID=7091 RepID=UPI000640A977